MKRTTAWLWLLAFALLVAAAAPLTVQAAADGGTPSKKQKADAG
jgi:hypothetical protein